MKKVLCIIVALLLGILALSGCSDEVKETVADKEDATGVEGNPKVRFEMQNGGVFVMELYPEYAPETVENFCFLVDSGFYDGITFHRVIPGFMAQTGDPTGTGTGGSDATITGEFINNGFKTNTLKHERGTVSMARTNDPNSASSQFFICFEAAPHLDGDYAAFGKVIEGMDVVDAIGEVATEMNKPVEDVVIKSAKIVK